MPLFLGMIMDSWHFRRTGNEINDGIDPVFKYPPYILELLDTAEVQRMQAVVQTGFSSWPYPNLQHMRKVHLIGTAKNAIRMWEAAVANGPAKIADESVDTYKAIIASAGVLHDIGHSPFSHDLGTLMKHFTGKTHEQIATEMIVGEYSLQQFYEEVPQEVVPKQEKDAMFQIFKQIPPIPTVLDHYGIPAETVAQIIDHTRQTKEGIEDKIGRNHFLRECIDSSIIDADKLDYLERDAQNAGITEARFKPVSVVQALGLVEWNDGLHVGISDKGIDMVSQLLFTRAYMSQTVYRHKTSVKIQAMVHEACKRFLRSLGGEKGREYGRWLHQLDDMQFQRFMTSNPLADPVAIGLFFSAKYNRREKYAIAYQIESKDIPLPFDAFENEETRKLKALLTVKNGFQNTALYTAEDAMQYEILGRANADNGKKIEDHEVIVFFDYVKDLQSREELLKKFKLFVYDHRNPEQIYAAAEHLQNPEHFDKRVDHLFQTFCRHRAPKYFLVLCPKEHIEKVQKATDAYIQELLK